MKIFYKMNVLLLGIYLILSLGGLLQAQTVNLITNGGFENWKGNKPEGWSGSKTTPTGLTVRKSFEKHQGSYALELSNNSDPEKSFSSQAVSVDAGKTYKVTYWVKGEGDIRFGLFDGRTEDGGFAYGEYESINSNVYVSKESKITAAITTEQAEFIFSVKKMATFKKILIDDVVIEELAGTEPGEEPTVEPTHQGLVCNNSFEDWNLISKKPNCWKGSKTNLGQNQLSRSNDAKFGSYAVLLENNSSSFKIFSSEQVVGVEAGKTYKVTYWVKGKGDIRFGLFDGRFLDNGFAYGDTESIDSDSYVMKEAEITASETTESAEFIFSVRNIDVFKGLLLDDVVIEELAGAEITHIITASAGENGSIAPNGSVDVLEGQDQEFIFTANDGYELDNVLVDGSPVNVLDNKYKFESVSAAHTIAVTFKAVPVEPTYQGLVCNNGFEEWTSSKANCWWGDKTTFIGFSAKRSNDKHLGDYALELSNSADSDKLLSSQAVSVDAGKTYKVTYWVKGEGDIRFGLFDGRTEDGGFAYGEYESINSTEYAEKSALITCTNTIEQAEFIFSVKKTGMFKGLILDDVVIEKYISSDANLLSISYNNTPIEGFAPETTEYLVTLANGTTEVPTLTYELSHANANAVVANATDFPAISTIVVTAEDGTTAKTYEVKFVVSTTITHIITASADENGSIAPNGSVVVEQGQDQEFLFTANDGYELDNVLVDGSPVNVLDNKYKFESVSAAHTIAVTFKLVPEEPTYQGLVCNNGFEEWTGSKPNCWWGEKTDFIGFNAKKSNDKHLGNHALELTNRFSADKLFSSTGVKVESGKTYKVTYYVKGKGEIRFGLFDERTEDGGFAHGEYESINLTEYAEKFALITCTNTTEQAEFIFSVRNTEMMSGILLDDVVIKEYISSDANLLSISYNNTPIEGFAPETTEYLVTLAMGTTEVPTLTYELSDANANAVVANATDFPAISTIVVTAEDGSTTKTYEVKFVVSTTITHIITASADENGSIAPSGSVVVEQGQDKEFLFTANDGYVLDEVLVDGSPVNVTDNKYQFVNVVAAHTIAVTFKEVEPLGLVCNNSFEKWEDNKPVCWYGSKSDIGLPTGVTSIVSLEKSTDSHTGTFAVGLKNAFMSEKRFSSTAVSVEAGKSYRLSYYVKGKGSLRVGLFDARPTDNGYAYNGLKEINSPSEYKHEEEILTATNSTDLAEFIFSVKLTEQPHNIVIDDVVIERIPGSDATLSSIESDGTVLANFNPTSETYIVKLPAGTTDVPNITYQLSDPSATAQITHATSIPGETIIVVTAEDGVTTKTYKIAFKIYHKITASAGDNGSITPVGDVFVEDGKEMKFIFTPKNNYKVEKVLVDGQEVNLTPGSNSYNFTNVSGDHTISVTFSIIMHKITASSDANGTISPAGENEIQQGKDIEFTFTPNYGLIVDKVLVDGTPMPVQGLKYKFVNVKASHTIAVSFKEIPEDPSFNGLVCNNSFENWTGNTPKCWFGEKTSLTSNEVVKSQLKHTGYYAVQLLNAGDASKNFSSQSVSVEAGKKYKVTYWAKGKGNISFGLFDGRSSDNGYAFGEEKSINNDGYVEYTDIVKAEMTSTNAQFIFSIKKTDASKNHILLDDVVIELQPDDISITDELLDASILLYPNPATTILNIDSERNISQIEVLNINAQIINSISVNDTNAILNIENLNNGIYFVRIKSDETTIVKKFIVNK